LGYVFAFDSEFPFLLWSENPTNLGQDFCTAPGVQEFLATEKEHNSGNLACDEELSLNVGSLILSSDDHKFEVEELQINYVGLNQ